MVLTADQIDALPVGERTLYWSREFGEEADRLVALLPAITEFCRHYQVRFELGPDDGISVVSTKPITPGGMHAWIKATWGNGQYVESEDDA